MNEDFKLDQSSESINIDPVNSDPVIISPDPDTVKKRRGRPKKEAAATSGPFEKPERKKKVAEKSLLDELKEKGKAYSEPSKTEAHIPEGVQQQAPTSNLLNGYLVLLICDAFLPLIVTKIAKAAGKNITTKQLKLTSTEKKELEPLADAAAAALLPNLSPTNQFLLALSAVYLSKAV
jgi:hypothetical protein